MSVYKGTRKVGVETDAPGAVALENPDLFQSYVVCSQYEETEGIVRTKLTFGKVDAGILRSCSSLRLYFSDETFDQDTKLKVYLVYNDDDDPIMPSFYSFGSGEFEVQVENTLNARASFCSGCGH